MSVSVPGYICASSEKRGDLMVSQLVVSADVEGNSPGFTSDVSFGKKKQRNAPFCYNNPYTRALKCLTNGDFEHEGETEQSDVMIFAP